MPRKKNTKAMPNQRKVADKLISFWVRAICNVMIAAKMKRRVANSVGRFCSLSRFSGANGWLRPKKKCGMHAMRCNAAKARAIKESVRVVFRGVMLMFIVNEVPCFNREFI